MPQNQTLGSQNDKLKSNYEAVHVELLQLREKHNSTRAQLLEAVESRVEADQRTETLVHKWKVQLEARTRELEALQAKLVPQDLDMLRAKVQEGLEVPHQRRVVGLEAEVDKYRQMFFNVRREHERCKASTLSALSPAPFSVRVHGSAQGFESLASWHLQRRTLVGR